MGGCGDFFFSPLCRWFACDCVVDARDRRLCRAASWNIFSLLLLLLPVSLRISEAAPKRGCVLVRAPRVCEGSLSQIFGGGREGRRGPILPCMPSSHTISFTVIEDRIPVWDGWMSHDGKFQGFQGFHRSFAQRRVLFHQANYMASPPQCSPSVQEYAAPWQFHRVFTVLFLSGACGSLTLVASGFHRTNTRGVCCS